MRAPVLVAGLLLLGGTAAADTTADNPLPRPVAVPMKNEPPPAAVISNRLFLQRCKDGCMFTQSAGTSSSRLNQTYLGGNFDGQAGSPGTGVPGTVYTIPACGTANRPSTEMSCDDAEWAEIVACVTELYSPYDVIVTDVDPGSSVPHHEAVAAGSPDDMGITNNGVGGVGPLSPGCALHEDTVSFSFDMWPSAQFYCAVIGQETGHGFGIEHTYNCLDPMGAGYITSCGPLYFRNETLPCTLESAAPQGAPRDCNCGGGMQNVHNKLLGVFGPNATPLPAPVVTLTNPTNGATFPSGNEFTISASGVLRRGMGKAELYFNGYKWQTQEAQNNQTIFIFTAPPELPDGVIDVEVRLWNDLETVYGTATATVTKGAPCADESTCAAGQRCEAGKCIWDPPSGNLGDACEYPQFCLSELCESGQCSSPCVVGIEGFCPTGFVCQGNGDGNNGFCLTEEPPKEGCSAGGDNPTAALFGQLGLVGVALAGVLRRRRRRV
jgi:MYXO-CTERM domain-containing protein